MQINRSNYEIWVIDHLDGKLDEHQTRELMLFLENNPDLKEEAGDFHILVPSTHTSFPGKKELHKTPAEITESQFELLCIGCLENDLSELQKAELGDAIAKDPSRVHTYELIMKLKLMPHDITYSGKSKLIKRSPFVFILRRIAIGLSAAAIIVFALISFLSRNNASLNTVKTSVAVKATGSHEKTLPVASAGNKQLNSVSVRKQAKKQVRREEQNDQTAIQQLAEAQATPVINKISFSPPADVVGESLPDQLLTLNICYIIHVDEERSRVGKFIARTFREKILREQLPADTRLTGFEIAEAGITGLNKLLGWEMALDQVNNGENGRTRSVYFSSKILKLNVPVKKSDTMP